MKMAEKHELLDYAVRMAQSTAELECRYKGGNAEDFWSSVLVGEMNRLVEENKALREALEVVCSRLNEDGVNTDNIGADLLRGQKLLNELGGDDEK